MMSAFTQAMEGLRMKSSLRLIVPSLEIAAYEALWLKFGTVKRMADVFRTYAHALPTEVAESHGIAKAEQDRVRDELRHMLPFDAYSALFYRDFEYPERLRDAAHPVEVLYYRGALDLLSSKSVAIVGTRKPSSEGQKRAQKLARILVANDITVMSGLADGVDTAAHRAALEAGGRTVAVIGTPLHEVYPKANASLQQTIVRDHLLVSQVPFCFAARHDWRTNRVFFPERNKTMSALSRATVIVEAGETSGTLTQARAALQQKRPLFILSSCFDSGLEWPHQFEKKGAVRLTNAEQILEILK